MHDYGENRFGSAQFIHPSQIRGAGLHEPSGGLFAGFDERGKAIYPNDQSAILLVGGARSGKGNFITPWQIDGAFRDHIISLDSKSQNGAIAGLQTDPRRKIINFAPRSGDTDRINVLSHLKDDSPTLVSDTKLFVQSWLPFNGSEHAEYFIATGQRFQEAAALTLVEIHGETNLPELADVMSVFGGDSDLSLALEDRMAQSRHGIARQVALELTERRALDNPNAGGFTGAMGEVAKSFACMSDPQIRDAVSPPYDFCFSELTQAGALPYQVNIQEAMEFSAISAPVHRALFTSALIYKRRALGSRSQLWLLDEIGNIGPWPLAI